MLLDQLKKQCGIDEPIFVEDAANCLNLSTSSARQMLKRWADKNALKKLDRGIYYFPKSSDLFGTSLLNPDKVIRVKYLGDKEAPMGYYSGLTLANAAGITTQASATTSIVTNATTSRNRQVNIAGTVITIKAPRTTITKENIGVLSFLDLLLLSEKYSEYDRESTKNILKSYLKKRRITKEQVQNSIRFYPQKTGRLLIDMEVYDVLA